MNTAQILAGLIILLFAVGPASAKVTLKKAFARSFLIGAALNRSQFDGSDARDARLVKRHFNSISPENALKWQSVHPRLGTYDFADPDRYVGFGERYKMAIIGHTLIWHNQTPKEVFEDERGHQLSRAELLERMRDHIRTVVGRYKGRIKGWDVVNEALNEDGTLRRSKWLEMIGDDYIEKAFEFAHEADPAAELYYNDYSLESAPKREGAVRMLRKLISNKVPITAVGLQGHDNLQFPTLEQQEAAIKAFAALGLKVMITELDVDVLPIAAPPGADININIPSTPSLDPYPTGLPREVQHKLAARYADLFGIFLRYSSVITRVTFWGVSDGGSWLNNYPVRGRTNYPLLFDRRGRAKTALAAVVKRATKTSLTKGR